nr:DUF4198 domain-containing protein [Ramlibacter paludis]
MRAWLAAALCCAAVVAQGHEFWMLPDDFRPPPGAPLRLALAVGVDFQGDPQPFSRALVARFRMLTSGANIDLLARVPADGAIVAHSIRIARPGGYVFALDTHPSAIVLEADKFNAYLRDEGLLSVLAARERTGMSAKPGRERYRRNVKALVRIGDVADAAFTRRTGQRLEIVPVNESLAAGAAPMGFQVLFDGAPLAGALVKIWHHEAAALAREQQVTDAQGRVAFALPHAGTWMASVVHMIPAEGTNDFDWDSYWGNLTFSAAGD